MFSNFTYGLINVFKHIVILLIIMCVMFKNPHIPVSPLVGDFGDTLCSLNYGEKIAVQMRFTDYIMYVVLYFTHDSAFSVCSPVMPFQY